MRKRILPIIVLSSLTALVIFLACFWFLDMTHDYPSVQFNSNWTVRVGNEEYPHVKNMILDEFELPKDNTEFVQDIHWEIGHGWSDELI